MPAIVILNLFFSKYSLYTNTKSKMPGTPWYRYVAHRLGRRTKIYRGTKRRLNRPARKVDILRAINKSKETHYLQTARTTVTTTLASTANVFSLLNGVAQGDTDSDRTGSRIQAKSLDIKCTMYNGTAGGQTNFRVIVLRQKNPRGVAPTSADLFVDSPAFPNTQFDMLATDFSSRFEILSDRMLYWLPNYAAQIPVLEYDQHIKLDDAISDYSLGTGSTITAIDKNAYYICFISDSTISSTVSMSYTFSFKDM